MLRLLHDISSGVRAFAPSRFPYLRFLFALLIGLVGALIFVYFNTPLPWMLGSLTTTTIAALLGAKISAPGVARTPMVVIVGVMVGATFTPDILGRFPEWWPSILGLLVLGIVSGATGLAYFRLFTNFDLPTAYFSSMPGGLIEMVTLADERGADIRTVALVHSVRILVVVFCVPITVRLMEGVGIGPSGGSRPSIVDADLVVFAWLIGTAVVGIIVGYLLRLPAAYLLGPLLVSAITHAIGISEFKFPSEILSVAQLVIGTSLGCRFAGVGTATIFRIFSMALGMTLFLLVITAAFAAAVARLAGFDFVPVFLAYAPGGLPEMSLVAISLHVEVAFVATHHIVRLFLVMGGAPLAYALLDKPKKPPE
jgi:uncharacterized protein